LSQFRLIASQKIANFRFFLVFSSYERVIVIIFGRKIKLISNLTEKIMPPISYSHFIKFLQDEINLPHDSIAIANRYAATAQPSLQQNPGLLPMVLWQYGLVNLEELDRIYDWLETR
jgi:hypothetical protein